MKDKIAREDIRRIWVNIGEIETKPHTLDRETAIGFCEKCKHETLQLVGQMGYVNRDDSLYYEKPYSFKCLACGTEWNCEEKTICTEVKKK